MSENPVAGGSGNMDEEALKRLLKEAFGEALPEGRWTAWTCPPSRSRRTSRRTRRSCGPRPRRCSTCSTRRARAR